MSVVIPAGKACRIGDPVMLSGDDVDGERREIESEYGTAGELRATRDFIGLDLRRRLVLERLGDLDFPEGR
ncbi:hypothetical protein BMYO_2138 [Bifidobacterium myosotis]|uniref:Uncharacterized protein n=2 Tax=Bifidobacterium myosotis TaxID=1630166 RepID=A0A261FD36_9BIFI|nr:hypothetical protein [Bifidobacterium myosotis]KAA8824961.1 hypothetical protein EMO91_13010 [Bifidobacterium myosotis]OZG57071.1 hypothetical protein BMYO_2138 [Bifidobacterium myosotis]